MKWAPRSISETRQTLAEAKQIRLLCPHCSKPVYASFEYPFTAERRQRVIKEAIDEHRKLCPKAPPEAQRVYRIDYPRT